MEHKHDFKAFPELTNGQMQEFYFDSPHEQIVRDFRADVIKVIDGDTIRVRWEHRDFDFPVRFADIAAPELKEDGGEESQQWLEQRILGEEVEIRIDPDNRVGKWGRLIGRVYNRGLNMGMWSMQSSKSVPFDQQDTSGIPTLDNSLKRFLL